MRFAYNKGFLKSVYSYSTSQVIYSEDLIPLALGADKIVRKMCISHEFVTTVLDDP